MMKQRLFRLLSLGALLAAAAPARGQYQQYTQFGQNKVIYDKFDWSIYRSTHFQIYFYPREKDSLGKIASYAESAYDELSRSLNYQIPHPIPLIAYASHAEFEQTNTELDFIDEGIGAFALPTRDRMVLPIDLPDQLLQQTIQHELTHVFEFEILFQGNFIRAFTSTIPQWFMEGLASYYGKDETNRSRMYLRDAVLSDKVPVITKGEIQPYFAYRFGHAVFDFIESEWGKDGVRDFVFDWRTNLRGGAGAVVHHAFDISPDDFDVRFRRYLRRKYLPQLVTEGEPVDFGDRFRISDNPSWELFGAPFPSGDLVAAVTTDSQFPDVVVLSTRDRKLFHRLSSGYTTSYEYLICPSVTITIDQPGRAVAVSPDGNLVAAFVRRERSRDLVLFDAISGGIRRQIPVPVDQSVAPAFSPDGKKVIFSAWANTASDIYSCDIDSGKVTNLTSDAPYDKAPTYSPDGKWIYYSSTIGTHDKIFRIDTADPTHREQVTFGDADDDDAWISADGNRLYFSSDRDGGVFNIYSEDLATGEIWQHTNVLGGAFTPSVMPGHDGIRLLFCAFDKLRYSLYVADAAHPFRKLADKSPLPTPAASQPHAPFSPAIEVAVDKDKINPKASHKLYVDGASVTAGVQSDGTIVSDSSLFFSDNLGDRRAAITYQSISSFSSFILAYYDLSRRTQLGVTAFDTREYYIGVSQTTGFIERDQRFLRQTGIEGLASYPFSRHLRADGVVGFISRSLDAPFFVTNVDGSEGVLFNQRTDNAPIVGLTLVADTALETEVGPVTGHRWSVGASYMPDLKSQDEIVGTDLAGNPIVSKHGGTLTFDVNIDLREYIRLTSRSLFAIRLYGARSTGNFPTIYYFGGSDTLRAYDYATEIGNEIGYANLEFRFPLIDVIALPYFALTNVRGRVFVDIGGANLTESTAGFRFWNATGHDLTYKGTTYSNHQLIDGLADYGMGFSLELFGLPLHWDFSRQWDFKTSLTSFRTSFYIGPQF